VCLAVAVRAQGHRVVQGIVAAIGQEHSMVNLKVRFAVRPSGERRRLPTFFAPPLGSPEGGGGYVWIAGELMGGDELSLRGCPGSLEAFAEFVVGQLQGLGDLIVEIVRLETWQGILLYD